MNEYKILNLLSMAQRAGRIASGDFAVTKALQEKKAKLLLIAEDASEDTKERYQRMASEVKIDVHYLGSKEMLGNCIGKDYRAAIVLLDDGFANAIAKHCC